MTILNPGGGTKAVLGLCLVFLPVAAAWAAQTVQVTVHDVSLQAEVADSDMLRQQGLMLKDTIEESEGMLFVFPIEARHAFWMKNMKFPLDIIWANKDKIIVDIKTDVQPCGRDCETLVPGHFALYVLEVKAGFVKKHGIKFADTLTFTLP
jgi:uncharacterized protein